MPDSFRDENRFPSPLIPILLMVGVIFLLEILIEYVLSHTVNLSFLQHVLVDAGGNALLLLLIFYFLLYRPFRQLDAARRQGQHDNQLLSRKLIRRSEEERQRLARDLHDDFGQVLTALQLGIATLKASCEVPEEHGLGCSRQADRLTRIVSELGDQVRSFTLDLRPAALTELGLEAAIEILIEGDWGGLTIDFQAKGSRRSASEIELALFRICQEALNNVVKHAQATEVKISLDYADSAVHLEVSDNGRGFDVEHGKLGPDRRRGFGLLGLRERVAALAGTLQLNSTPGEGTTIQIVVPDELYRRYDEAD